MANVLRSTSLPLFRLTAGLLLLASLVLSVAWAGPQDGKQGKKRGEEEEEKAGNVKNKPPPDVDQGIRPDTIDDTDFTASARLTSNLAIRELYQALAIRGDKIELKNPSSRPRVEPVISTDPNQFPAGYKTHVLDSQGKAGEEIELDPKRVVKVVSYEEEVRDAVKKFLDKGQGDAGERLSAAERILSATLRFHESLRNLNKRTGDGWIPIEKELRTLLMSVLVDRLKGMAAAGQWDDAFDLVSRLKTISPRDDVTMLADPLAKLLAKAATSGLVSEAKVHEAYRFLRRLADEHPESAAAQRIKGDLKKRAQQLFDQAKAQEKTNAAESQSLLLRASEIFPDLDGLSNYRRDRLLKYPVLRVGVRRLPAAFSPARAVTDNDRRAVELIFEGLVRYSPDERGVWAYRPVLSEGRPRLVPGGRVFQLPANAAWSNGEPLIRADIKETVDLLLARKETGIPRAWSELLQKVDLRADSDPSRVELTLSQGWPEPLSLMTFKILPHGTKVDSEAFAEKPIGSGPFQFDKRGSDPLKRSFVSLNANPSYGRRAANTTPPIQEVHFIEYADPVEEMANDRLDVALDLSAIEADALLRKRDVRVPLPNDPGRGPNRRIYFLVVNKTLTPLDNAAFRRAIAYAIDRQTLLDNHFRGPLGRKVHRPLNGPYPPGSWACKPELETPATVDCFDVEKAKSAFNKDFGERPGRVRLKYPAEDPAVKAAMEALCASVNKELGNDFLEPLPRPERELNREIKEGKYDLAYTYYDFPDETFWLGPLVGGQGMTDAGGGRNLSELLKNIQKLRDPVQIRLCAHQIHAEFLNDQMPFIPLWQLDPLLALQSNVKTPWFDPWLVLSDLDKWSIGPR